MEQQILIEKWKILIEACKNYYIDSIPTGLSDSKYDELETLAANDGFFVRDYVFQTYTKGQKAKNQYIEKIKKTKVTDSSMLEAIKSLEGKLEKKLYCDLKYDGSSIAIYLDPSTGIPKKEVTVGNLNIDNFGVDQTWKLHNFIPPRFPKGITAIQAEALIDINRLGDIDPDKARSKANGLINSLYCEADVSNLLTLRAYRYYTDDSPAGNAIREMDYRDVLKSFPVVKSHIDGHILFSPADSWTSEELEKMPGFTETDKTKTSTGYFLNDGWVLYDSNGICQGALKYSGAGLSTEGITKTKVQSIQWNNQVSKGKDSWSANVIIDPIVVKGCTIRKPSAGSISKLVKNNITPGAEISVIMANSTIPLVSEVFKPGNGDYMWPTCSCGYNMSEKDIYGSLLKCGNPECTERIERMRRVLKSSGKIDLNELLVIDRFKWQDTDIDTNKLIEYVSTGDIDSYHSYLMSYMKTELQKRNMELVWKASWIVLRDELHKK